MTDAPSRYSARETLRDGRPIEIRALESADRDALLGAVGRMSEQSIYRRFFSPKRQFTEQEVDFYTDVDFVNHVALLAVLQEQGREVIAGGARYVVSKPGAAEVAFTVDDAHQGLGIGTLLMRHLMAIARRSGIAELHAEVLSGNAAMLKVFKNSGLEMRTERDQGVTHVTLKLSQDTLSPRGRG